MYYFNNTYLLQYLHANAGQLKVLVDGDFYNIASDSDLARTDYGIGYEETGKSKAFHYQQIQAVMIGDIKFTIEQLQASFDSDTKDTDSEETPSKAPETSSPDDSTANIDPDAEDKPEKDKKPDKQNSNYYYDNFLLNERIRNGLD